MNRRDFLGKLLKGGAAAGATAAAAAVVAPAPVTAAPTIIEVSRDKVTLVEFEAAVTAYSKKLIPLAELNRIRDLYMRQTHIPAAVEYAENAAGNDRAKEWDDFKRSINQRRY